MCLPSHSVPHCRESDIGRAHLLERFDHDLRALPPQGEGVIHQAHVRVFSVARRSTWTFCPQGSGFLFPEVCHPREDGHVASSLSASLLPAQRARPERWCTLLRVSLKVRAVPNCTARSVWYLQRVTGMTQVLLVVGCLLRSQVG